MKEFSIEELEQAIESDKSEVPAIDVSDKLIKFIQEVKIEHGRVPVANFLIYHHYCKKWSPQGNKLSYIEFFRQFNKVFDQRRTGSTRYYMLNKGIFSIDKESINDAKQFREEQLKKGNQEIKI